MQGTYLLLIEVSSNFSTEVGALGQVEFDSGYYMYVGSDMNSNGFGRVERHLEKDKNPTISSNHWHIDYLLSAAESQIISFFTVPTAKECELSSQIGKEHAKFGASDCQCKSHLHYSPNVDAFIDTISQEVSM